MQPPWHRPGTSQSIAGAPQWPAAARTLAPCARTGRDALPFPTSLPARSWEEGKSKGQGWSGAARGISQGRKMSLWSQIYSSFLVISQDLPCGAVVHKDEPLQPHHAAGLLQRGRWAKAAPPPPPFGHKGPTLTLVHPAPRVQKTSEPPALATLKAKIFLSA